MKLCPAFELCSCVTFTHAKVRSTQFALFLVWVSHATADRHGALRHLRIPDGRLGKTCRQAQAYHTPSSPRNLHASGGFLLCTNLAVQRAHSLKNLLHRFQVHHLLTSAHSCMNKLQTMPAPIQARRSSRYISLPALSSSSCHRRTVFEGNRMLSAGRHGPTLC